MSFMELCQLIGQLYETHLKREEAVIGLIPKNNIRRMTMDTSIANIITPGQRKQIKQFAQNAVNPNFIDSLIKKLGLTKANGQNIVEHGDEFIEKLRDSMTGIIKDFPSLSDYANEETSSSCGYVSGYTKPKDLTIQINYLRELFPNIGYVNQDLLKQIESGVILLPAGAEGWFAIPNLTKNRKIFGSTYSEAVQKILNLLEQTRSGNLYNFCEKQVDERHLRQTLKTKKFFRKLAKEQDNSDILIIAAQFGILHRGRSVRRVRAMSLSGVDNQVELGTFAIGCMLLTHPERLQQYNDLWIDCPGDEFKLDNENSFSQASSFSFHGGALRFDVGDISKASGLYGSACAFISQQG